MTAPRHLPPPPQHSCLSYSGSRFCSSMIIFPVVPVICPHRAQDIFRRNITLMTSLTLFGALPAATARRPAANTTEWRAAQAELRASEKGHHRTGSRYLFPPRSWRRAGAPSLFTARSLRARGRHRQPVTQEVAAATPLNIIGTPGRPEQAITLFSRAIDKGGAAT
ncbi:hypothetical protein HPP92_012808 [Vanilla planifolia]|uniref:Uncharacterized protein n=1 Tax=Vanilla planifolia TaxID=51239 RepID=A0A835QN12_VANPL|nr:hypothetical protein HPP92_013231 [Vanilla planifolia]KAG0478089.1 hypothetical protein HPP92_012808 [Vanilla planifolia]